MIHLSNDEICTIIELFVTVKAAPHECKMHN